MWYYEADAQFKSINNLIKMHLILIIKSRYKYAQYSKMDSYENSGCSAVDGGRIEHA